MTSSISQFRGAVDDVAEDERGFLVPAAPSKAKKRSATRDSAVIRRGVVRFLMVCIDASDKMALLDFKPMRMTVVRNSVEEFVKVWVGFFLFNLNRTFSVRIHCQK